MDDTSQRGTSSTLAEQEMARSALFASLFGISLTRDEASNLGFTFSDRSQHTSGQALAEKGGMMFPVRHEELVRQRQERYRFSLRKWKRVQTIVSVLSWIPFLRGVMACNTLSFEASRDDSDIDLFIISSAGLVWWTRALALTVVSLFRLRPGQRPSLRDSICMCFFTSEGALDLSSLQLARENGLPDVYLCWWVANCMPVYDEGVYEAFVRANTWTREVMPHWRERKLSGMRSVRNTIVRRVIKKMCEWLLRPFGRWIEPMSRSLQMRVMPEGLRAACRNGGTSVVCTDEMIKLHYPFDRRAEIRDAFAKLMNEYGR